jgi:DNA-binding CsgD family transcriptional regulator
VSGTDGEAEAPARTALPRPGAGPLLEREAEVAAIRAFVERAREGVGGLIAIEAGAGMGKTRLLGEARRAGAEAALGVLSARAAEPEGDLPYGVVRQLFEPLLATAPTELRGELWAGAASLAAPLFDERQLAAALEGAADTSFSTLHGLYWLAANVALQRPTLLVIDDVHWADAPSLRWLCYLARRLEGVPLTVAMALRPPEESASSRLVTELVTDPSTVLVRPRPLGLESVAALAERAFGAEPDPRFCASCRDATGGNPLFLRALLDALAGEGLAPTAVSAQRALEVGPAPVARALALRLARLPAEATLLARAVALLGDGAAPATAAALAGLDAEATSRAATQLARSDIFRERPQLEFVHPVMRAAIYEQIGVGERVDGHRRAAGLLADAGAEPERVAAHLLRVPPAGDGFVPPVLREAAARSVGRGAADAAVAYLRRALEEPPEPAPRAELLAQLGMTERLVDAPAAADHLGEAMEDARDPARKAELAVEYGRALWYAGRNREAIEVFQGAIDGLGGEQRQLRQLLEAEAIGSGWWEAELYPAARELLDGVIAEEERGGPVAEVLLATLAFYETRRGADRERTIDLAQRSLASGTLERQSAVAIFYAIYALSQGGLTDIAGAIYDRAVSESRRRGDIFSVGGLLGFRGLLATECGDLVSAAEDLREAVEIMRLRGALMNLQYYAAFLADVQIEQGDLEGAESTLASTGLGDQLPSSAHFSYFMDVRGRLLLERRRPAEALALFMAIGDIYEALEIRSPAFRGWRSRSALAMHALGHAEEARRLAREELELARRWGTPRPIGIALRTLALLEGGPEGEAHLREAVDVLVVSSARLEHARTLVELGSALRRGNRRSEARDALRQGFDLAQRLRGTAVAERARAELAALGVRPKRAVAGGADALTPSEQRVAAMAAEGMSNKDIAQALFVTVKTVEVHLSSAYRKLSISSRTQLAKALPETSAPVA